jgi:hypothetical protein
MKLELADAIYRLSLDLCLLCMEDYLCAETPRWRKRSWRDQDLTAHDIPVCHAIQQKEWAVLNGGDVAKHDVPWLRSEANEVQRVTDHNCATGHAPDDGH